MTRITIFDYGAGNLHSLAKVLAFDGAEVRLESSQGAALETDVLVLPGVGAFTNAAERLAPAREAMRAAIADGLPTLGICLGMQLLFDESEEGGGAGLGVVPGVVRRLHSRRVPQIGWNEVVPSEASSAATPMPRMAYFANSYVCVPREERVVTAWTTHDGDRFAAAVGIANTVGVQFHPEKSSESGVRFVRDTVRELAARGAGRLTGGRR
jgi:glutamine amidotransferase